MNVFVSSSASGSFMKKVQSKVKGSYGSGAVYSLKEEGVQSKIGKGDVCIVLTPSSAKDYRVAKELADGGFKTVVVNGLFKVSQVQYTQLCYCFYPFDSQDNKPMQDPKSIPPYARMAYYFKPLTYNSQIAGYLIRQYPNNWTVLDVTNKELGRFKDEEILVEKTNTPDLRTSVRLAQKSADERAIRERSKLLR